MAQDERSPFKIRKQVEISKDDYEWFKKTHGEEAKFSWLVNILVNKYRLAYEEEKDFPLEVAAKAAEATLEETNNV